jgi:flagellar hook-length control protein FliK
MMGAASLPQPQGSTPAGFAAFLSTIGQTPTGTGEDGGFEQLLAAIPKVDAAAVKAAAGSPVTPETPVSPVAVAGATAIVPAAAAGEGVAIDAAVEAPVAIATDGAPQTEPDTDTAAASAAKLLIAMNGNLAKPETKSLNALATEAQPDGAATPDEVTTTAKPAETVAAPETPAPTTPATTPASVAALAVAAAPVAAAVAVMVAGKPQASDNAALPTGEVAQAAETITAAPTTDKARSAEAKPAAPELEMATAAPVAGKPRPAPLPGPVVPTSEAVAAKPADAAPSMTVQFAQPATTGVAASAHAAAPVTVAERILDLASDGAWIDQLAHDIAATKSDSGDISFRLMPRHLGRLDVAMRMGDEGVALKLDTQHEATATIVTAAQGRLVEDLRQQGVRVTGSEVTCTPGDTGRQMQGQAQGQGRTAAPDASHLIETANERAAPRAAEAVADRRGRFA